MIEKLNKLYERSSTYRDLPIDRNLYGLLCNVELLEIAYHNIKSKPGNLTSTSEKAGEGETLDGMSTQVLADIAEKLRDESFQFRTARRAYIPKPNGEGNRPITVSPPRDKIVQEAMRMILNAIYEPLFKEESHGFRPQRGCHSALKYINQKFQSSTWVIEGDISKCFDSIDHHKLMQLIESKILDRKFTRLIWKSLRANHMENKSIKHNIIGTFQGSIISPILANIYLDQLDEVVHKIRKEFDQGSTSKINPAYNQFRYRERLLREKGETEEANKIAKQRLQTKYSNFEDPSFKKLAYVRYADDWMVGIKGTKQEAEEIRNLLEKALSDMGLTLNKTKTKITNINSDKLLFLGTVIYRAKHRRFSRLESTLSIKRNSQRLRMEGPISRIKKKLSEAGFILNGKSHPKFVWMSMTHERILDRYNAVMRGIANYYYFAHNYSKVVTQVEYFLRGSCAKLLAAKLSLKTQSKVFLKFGTSLTSSSGKTFEKPNYRMSLKYLTTLNPSGVVRALYSYKSQARLDSMRCKVCDSDVQVEMHHIRALKNLKPKTSIVDRIMIKEKRKQIALCRSCHMKKHNNIT